MENREKKIRELKRYSYIKGSLLMQRDNLMMDENYNDEEYNELTNRINIVGKQCKDLRHELVRDYELSFEEALAIQVEESNKGSSNWKR